MRIDWIVVWISLLVAWVFVHLFIISALPVSTTLRKPRLPPTLCCAGPSACTCLAVPRSSCPCPPPALPVRPLRITFVTYATGPYNAFVADLWASIQRFAFPGHDVHLHLFTDRAEDPTFLAHPNVHKKQQGRVGWPYDSLGRHFLYLESLQWLAPMDYVLAIDSDSVIVAPLDVTMLGESIACLQAWSFGFHRSRFTYDQRLTLGGEPFSEAYIAPNEGEKYYCGGIFGGSLAGFGAILERTVALARADLSKDPPRIALWHDESYLNRVFVDAPPTVALGPAYMYPEPPADEWLYTTGPNGPHPDLTQAYRSSYGMQRVQPLILNLGVRKHAANAVATYQAAPSTAFVPNFMSPSSAQRALFSPGFQDGFLEQVAFIVRAFEEASCLDRLLQSISYLYPRATVLVLDDSPSPLLQQADVHEWKMRSLNLTYMTSEYVGEAAALGIMLEMVSTPYVLLLDPNHVLLEGIALEEMFFTLKTGVFDIVGGCVDVAEEQQWSYSLSESSGVLTRARHLTCARTGALSSSSLSPVFSTPSLGCWHADFISGILLASTSFLLRFPLDTELKAGAQLDFFLRVKEQGGSVGMCRGVTARQDAACSIHPPAPAESEGSALEGLLQKRQLRTYATPEGRFELVCESALRCVVLVNHP
jgi:hypothetical protein